MDSIIESSISFCDYILDPMLPAGIPKALLSKCAGVAFFHSVTAAVLVSASSANGIVLRRDTEVDQWSPPSAICMTELGLGITFGVKKSDIIMILMDDDAVKALCGEVQVKLGGNLTAVAGPLAQKGDAIDQGGAVNLSNKGSGVTYCYALTEGFFSSLSLNMGVLVARGKINTDFYKISASPEDIVFKKGSVTIPADSHIPELHKKLNLMVKGE